MNIDCSCCGDAFEHICESTVMERCPKCQARFRTLAAQEMHLTGSFASYGKAHYKRLSEEFGHGD